MKAVPVLFSPEMLSAIATSFLGAFGVFRVLHPLLNANSINNMHPKFFIMSGFDLFWSGLSNPV